MSKANRRRMAVVQSTKSINTVPNYTIKAGGNLHIAYCQLYTTSLISRLTRKLLNGLLM